MQLPRLDQKELENMIRPITSKENESVIKNLLMNKSPGPDGFIDKFYQIFEELPSILLKLFKKIKKKGTLPNSFSKASII